MENGPYLKVFDMVPDYSAVQRQIFPRDITVRCVHVDALWSDDDDDDDGDNYY